MQSERQRKHLEKLRIFHIGRKRSKETKEKISRSLKGKTLGRKRPNHSYWLKTNHPKGMLGKKHSEKTKKLMSVAKRGKKQDRQWRKNRSLAVSGKKHWNWKGGPIVPRDIKNKIRKSLEYKEWRKNVFERDGYSCQKCNKTSSKNVKVCLQAHHIKSFALFSNLRFNIDNGQTLCRECHLLTL